MGVGGWVWLIVHNSQDGNFMQEVSELKTQKERAGDEDSRKEIGQQIDLKSTERDLAWSKWVRLRNITLRQLLYAMKWTLVSVHWGMW